ncbi:EF-hand calcium-binding domain-containing protein 6-like [Saccoglossus kowalevskii]
MKNILQSLRFPLTSEEMENLCQRFDFTSSGLFHYMQFMELYTVNGQISPYDKQADKIPTPGFVMTKMRKKVIPEWKSLRRAFKKVDRKNDGFVTITEFKQVLKENKCAISEEDLYHLSSQLDSSLDGNISYDEFINAMCD